MIVGVAIRNSSMMVSLAAPKRHGDCMSYAQMYLCLDLLEANLGVQADDQGFITDKGEYLTRPEAAAHAYECGQIDRKLGAICSEDLW